MTDKYKYENLTWPEVNEAVEKGLIPILPVGTTEQHGPHLPIKMDSWRMPYVDGILVEPFKGAFRGFFAISHGMGMGAQRYITVTAVDRIVIRIETLI